MSGQPKLGQISTTRSSALRGDRIEGVAIGEAVVDGCSFEEARAAILKHAVSGRTSAYVVTANAQHVVLLQDDLRLREIYQSADLVVADGVSLLLAARLFGKSLQERVTGVDLFQALCTDPSTAGLRVFLLGGLPGSAEASANRMRAHNPGLQVSTYCPPRGFEQEPLELQRIANLIRASNANLIFVGLGAPKQEYWIYEHGRKMGANLCIGIGGSFEMVAGLEKRAPHWVRSLGLEWLFRLCRDPRNKWRRYLIGNLRFLTIILKQRFREAGKLKPSARLQVVSALRSKPE